MYWFLLLAAVLALVCWLSAKLTQSGEWLEAAFAGGCFAPGLSVLCLGLAPFTFTSLQPLLVVLSTLLTAGASVLVHRTIGDSDTPPENLPTVREEEISHTPTPEMIRAQEIASEMLGDVIAGKLPASDAVGTVLVFALSIAYNTWSPTTLRYLDPHGLSDEHIALLDRHIAQLSHRSQPPRPKNSPSPSRPKHRVDRHHP
jgi:hypothetical protein